jgi:MYXO-CTERM domain-containing protein
VTGKVLLLHANIVPISASTGTGRAMIVNLRRRVGALALAATSLCLAAGAYAEPVARLILHSVAGDPIGMGQDFDITYVPLPISFFSANVFRTIGSASVQPAGVQFFMGTSASSVTPFAILLFATDQLGIPIEPGVYSNAESAVLGSPGHPGLEISLLTNGCTQLTGNFVVQQATFGPADAAGIPTIEKFVVTFEQHCEFAAAALFGTFTYDAIGSPPQSVPISPVAALAGLALAGLAELRRRRSMLRGHGEVY